MRKILLLVVILFVAVFAVGAAKNGIVKGATETVCRKITGLELKIGSLNLSLLGSSLGIKNIRMFNPASFQDRLMFDVPEVYGKIDVPSLFKGPIHVNEIRLDLREITIVKGKDGKLNLDALKPAEKKAAAAQPAGAKPEPSAKKGAPQIHIDRLVLKVGKVVYKDYTVSPPSTREFDIKLNETHEHITNIQALIPLILTRAVMNTAVGSLVNLDMTKMLKDFDVSSVDLKSMGLDKFQGAAKFLGDGATTTGAEAGSAAEKAAKAVQGLFGALAGSDTQQ